MSQPGATDSPAFRLCLLGPPSLSDASGQVLPGLGPGKPLALLAYLALTGGARREALVALLWGDVGESRARNAFRQTLHRLRTTLSEEVLPQNGELLRLSAAAISCDVHEFEKHVEQHRLGEAIALYRGEFLEGLSIETPSFAEWADEHRRRYAARFRAAITQLAEDALAAGDTSRAVELAHQLTTASPLDPDAAILEATALVAAGRRTEAVAALSVHARRTESELSSRPQSAVATMLSRLMRQGPSIRGIREPRTGAAAGAAFVGRDRELSQLIATWRRVQQGEGTSVLIVGPEGIGKTRLVDELIERVRSLGIARVFRGRESPHAGGIPYGAAADALRDAPSAPGVAGASQYLLAEAARLLPQLRDRFSLPDTPAITDEAARVRFFEGIAALLDAIAYEEPILLVFEDLDHAAAATRDLVRYLEGRLGATSVLLIATGESPASVGLAGGPMALGPISEADALVMLDSVLGSERLNPDERRRLAGLAGGVPYKVMELAERARAGEVPTAAPVTLREVMWRRLHRSSPYEQRVFVATALFGRPVPIRLLAAASHLSEPAALDAVLDLERRGLVIQRSDGVESANAAAAQLALEGTGSAGTTLLAGWAADALAQDPDARPGELVRLYSAAGRPRDAQRHARAAAWEAAAAGAVEDARHFASFAARDVSSPSQRADAETLLRSLGGGLPLLAGDVSDVDEAEIQRRTEPPARQRPVQEAPAAQRPAGGAAKWRVRPQLLIIGIIALLTAGLVRFALAERGIVRGDALADTLVVAERAVGADARLFAVTGRLVPTPAILQTNQPASALRWPDAIAFPWTNALISPDAQRVAIERVTAGGSDLYLISADRRDTVPLATSRGDDIAVGWSPDGQWLLVLEGRTGPGGDYDTDLFAYPIDRTQPRVILDATPGSVVAEASWSPRGPYIAWTARAGRARQQDVFVSDADGANVRNISDHPAEDYHIAWAPDGERLAFTSERDGNPEIYAHDLVTKSLRRLTFDDATDDRAAYSPDGRFLALESTRGGTPAVYVVPGGAGAPRRIGPADRRLALVEWRGTNPAPIDRVLIRSPAAFASGASVQATADVLDATGQSVSSDALRWISLDPDIIAIRRPASGPDAGGQTVELLARGTGLARITASVAGWRSDTTLVRVGGAVPGMNEVFDGRSLDAWSVIGSSPPRIQDGSGRDASPGLVLTGQGRQTSGAISTATFALRPGVSLRVWMHAPFASGTVLASSAAIGLVPAAAGSVAGARSGWPVPLVGVEWRGDAGRIVYTADRESWSDPSSGLGSAPSHHLRIDIDSEGRANFYVDDLVRRRSSTRVVESVGATLVHVFIGSRGAAGRVAIDDVRVQSVLSTRRQPRRR
jgi:DNA-binding SARP family transcriptional activator